MPPLPATEFTVKYSCYIGFGIDLTEKISGTQVIMRILCKAVTATMPASAIDIDIPVAGHLVLVVMERRFYGYLPDIHVVLVIEDRFNRHSGGG
jgi:hypothetical protein